MSRLAQTTATGARSSALAGMATAGLLTLGTFGLYVWTAPPTITWWFGGADSGELAAAAFVLGIPHPTGYPLFVVLGHIVTHLPVGPADPAGRVNVMNAALAALGGGMLVLCIGDLSRNLAVAAAVRWAAAGLVAATIAVSQLYWSQAIIGEVYALHAALTAIVLLAWAHPSTPLGWRGAAHGLALTNHLTSALLLVAALIAFMLPWTRGGTRTSAGSAGWFVVGLVIPLLLYALLPLRAAQHPTSNWGDPRTVDRFVAHVTGRQYASYVNWRAPGSALRDAASLLGRVLRDLAPWVVPAALVGYVRLRALAPSYALFTGLIVLGTVLGAALYRVPDRGPYLLPVYLILGVWAGVGLISVLSALPDSRASARAAAAGAPLVAAGATLLVLVTVLWGVRTGTQVNLRGDDSALRFATATLNALPSGATYYSGRDDVTFSLWYAQRVLGLRPDVRVVDIRNPELTRP